MDKSESLFHFFEGLDRSIFINNDYNRYSNYDQPLPIGHGQTISQPTLVYTMTWYLQLSGEDKVLEIGTGSGYQTAFLAEFSGEVFTVEKIGHLSKKAEERLHGLGYSNISFKVGDGSDGWPEFAPYTRIICTAAAGSIPEPLIEQLAPGGLMIIPVGEKGWQELLKIRKSPNGNIETTNLGDVRFVEFKGKYGWKASDEEHSDN